MSFFKRLFNIRESIIFDNILIVGTEDFISRTINALNLVKTNDPKNYRYITNYTKRIIQKESQSAYTSNRYIFVSSHVAFGRIIWYSSILVHEAVHIMTRYRFNIHTIFFTTKKQHIKMEMIAVKAQAKNLERLGESKDVINRLLTQGADHIFE